MLKLYKFKNVLHSNSNISFSFLETKILLNSKKNIIFFYNKNYGVSYTTSFLICQKIGFNHLTPINSLTKNHFEFIMYFFKKFFKKKKNLKNIEFLYLKNICDVNLYKNFRYKHGLPVRGQRTSTNAMSCRSLAFHNKVLNSLT